MELSKQVAIRTTEADLDAARARAKHLGLPLSQVIRIFLIAFGRGDLLVTQYLDEPKASITIAPLCNEPKP